MDEGMKLREWLNTRMDEQNVTTARVFMIIGFTLGLILGISGLVLTILTIAIL